jgi:hypothetical protein
MAKAFWNHCERTGKRLKKNQHFGDEGWAIYFKGRKRSRIDKTDLCSKMFDNATCDYWIEKKQIKVEYIHHSIDWKNCELVMK